ncbi:ankyrin repeat-containing domain protein [Xylaria sp. FL1042]|nr:ankyrin repeat-containing domain protein [Xylaria sp. FL1042]
MATQLTLDALQLVADELTAARKFRAAMRLSSVSRAVYDAIYLSILRANGSVITGGNNGSEFLDFYIKSNNAALVAMFLECTGIDVNIPYSNFESILSHAADEGAASVVEFLLKAGANIVGADNANRPLLSYANRPIFRAVRGGHVHVTRMLLENGALGAHVKLLNRFLGLEISGNILVHDLIHVTKTVELVETLIPYSSNLDELDGSGLGLLHRVSDRINTSEIGKIVKALVKAGAKTEVLDNGPYNAQPQLQYRNGQPHRHLLQYTPLDYACKRAEPDVIQALLEMGAIIGETTLHDLLFGTYEALTTSTGKMRDERVINTCKSAKLLLDHGLSGPQAYFELDCAQIKTDSNELWTILIEGGAKSGVFNAHRRNKYGQTFLAQLVSRQFGEMTIVCPSWKPNLLRALVKAGSDPNTVDGGGLTPLHYAILHGDFDSVKLLIELGADPSQEVNGATPTHYAFGKPFDCSGPVVQHLMSSFLERLIKFWAARYAQVRSPEARLELVNIPVDQYRKPKLNLFLTMYRDPFLRMTHDTLVRNAGRQIFSIMAILQPWADTARDENGQTPKDIAKSATVGLLEETTKASFCLELHNNSDVRERYAGLDCNMYYSERGYVCDRNCEFCGTFPRPLLDLATGDTCPIPLTQWKVITEHD